MRQIIFYPITFIVFILYLVYSSRNKENIEKPIKAGNRRLFAEDSVSLLLAIAGCAVLSRLFFTYLGYIGFTGGSFSRSFWTVFHNVFVKAGDAPHYLKIAEHWYASSGEDAKYIVFFPLYPMLIKAVQFILRDYFWSGILISNAFFAGACVYLYKLARLDFKDSDAKTAVIFLMLFPFSFFFSGVFTESLFIFLSLSTLYYARKSNWMLASFLGFLAATTRLHGILLLLPVLYEYCLQNELFTVTGDTKTWFKKLFQNIKPDILFFLFIPFGLFLYLLLNKTLQGDWFMFYAHQRNKPWYQGTDWIGANLAQHYRMGQDYFKLGLYLYKVQLIGFFVVIGLFFYGFWKKVRTSYLLYTLIYLFMSFTASWLISGPRYIMGDVPIYLLFASVSQNKYIKTALLILSAVFLVIYTVSFLQGQAIM